MAAKVNENTEVALPLRNIISIIVGVAIATWAYFGIIERLNNVETNQTLMHNDVVENTEFRIKWPRGQAGSLPADQEQFMMIEDLYKSVDKLQKAIEDGMHNKVNIEFLTKQMNKVLGDIEKLKDKQRTFGTNGNGAH